VIVTKTEKGTIYRLCCVGRLGKRHIGLYTTCKRGKGSRRKQNGKKKNDEPLHYLSDQKRGGGSQKNVIKGGASRSGRERRKRTLGESTGFSRTPATPDVKERRGMG